MKIIEVHPTDKTQWDNFFKSTGEGNICQSFYWAELIEQLDNAQPIFLKTFDDEGDVSYLLLFRKKRWNRDGNNTFNKLCGYFYQWIEWMDGPVFLTNDNEKIVSSINLYLSWIENYSIAHKQILFATGHFARQSKYANSSEIESIFRQNEYNCGKWGTYLTDLTKTDDEIWNGIHKSARTKIRKCARYDLQFEKIKDYENYILNIYNPSREKRLHDKLTVDPPFSRKIFNESNENGYSYWVARSKDRIIYANIGLYIYDNVATQMASIITMDALEKKIPAQDFIHWELLKYAKNQGCHIYDVAGVNPHPANQKEEGIREFKKKWGGIYVEYNMYDKKFGCLMLNVIDKITRLIKKGSK